MRLSIVSNRLPITIVEKEGNLEFKESVDGLVSGLTAYWDLFRGSSFVYDWNNENMFKVLLGNAYSIKVGMIQSNARYNVHTYMDVVKLLEELAKSDRN